MVLDIQHRGDGRIRRRGGEREQRQGRWQGRERERLCCRARASDGHRTAADAAEFRAARIRLRRPPTSRLLACIRSAPTPACIMLDIIAIASCLRATETGPLHTTVPVSHMQSSLRIVTESVRADYIDTRPGVRQTAALSWSPTTSDGQPDTWRRSGSHTCPVSTTWRPQRCSRRRAQRFFSQQL